MLTGWSLLKPIRSRSLTRIRLNLLRQIDSNLLKPIGWRWLRRIHLSSLRLIDSSLQMQTGQRSLRLTDSNLPKLTG